MICVIVVVIWVVACGMFWLGFALSDSALRVDGPVEPLPIVDYPADTTTLMVLDGDRIVEHGDRHWEYVSA